MQGPSRASGLKNDINVTPLVDVVLVLLVIFMVITPMLQKGAEVELPLTEHPKEAKSVDDQVTITVKKNDELFLETDPVSEAGLAQELSRKFSETNGSAPIFIKGDQGANYGRVRMVMKMVQDAGFARVGVITKEPERSGG